MKAADLIGKSKAELNTALAASRRKLFKLRLVKASGELTKTHEIRQTRRDIARVITMIAKEGKKT